MTTTNNEIADKKNEVEMLRLELGESRLYRELGLAGVNNINDVIMKNLRRINIQQHKTIDELKTTINWQCDTYDSMYSTMLRMNHGLEVDLKVCGQDVEGLEAELSARKEDSRVLMQVVEAVRHWHKDGTIPKIVEDYLVVPESPVVTLKTPSIGTRVVHEDEIHTIDEPTMRAVRRLLDCDGTWVLYTEEEAVEVMQHKTTIEEERNRVDERDRHIEELAYEIVEYKHHIDGLKRDLDARNKDIEDFKAIEQKETDRLHETIEELNDRNKVQAITISESSHRLEAKTATIMKMTSTIEELKQCVGQNDVVIIQRNLALLGKDTEIDQLRRSNTAIDAELEELSQLYCNRCDQLEKIDNVIGYDFPIPLGGILTNIRRIINDRPTFDCGITSNITRSEMLSRKLGRIEKILDDVKGEDSTSYLSAADKITKIIQEE